MGRVYLERSEYLLHFWQFRIMGGYVLMQGNNTTCTSGKKGRTFVNIEIIAISEICEVSISVYAAPEGQVTQSLTPAAGQVLAE
jgi:hypothetical protein